jgi:hypothetical protein
MGPGELLHWTAELRGLYAFRVPRGRGLWQDRQGAAAPTKVRGPQER